MILWGLAGRFASAQDMAPPREHATGRQYRDSIAIGAGDTIRLPRQFIQPRSFRISTADGVALRDTVDYRLDARNGLVILTPAGRAALDSARASGAEVSYTALPYSFAPVYRKRELVLRRDTARGDTLQVAAPSTPMTMESIFGSELQKSGYIGRGFTVGTNRDLSISSGFRLSLSGKLAEDITLLAALTDENTPIQPEGNTRTLQELDKVFIRISNPNLAATLGDFSLAYEGTEFGRYNRKLSGVLAEGKTDAGDASVSFASMKGTFRTIQYNGIDGVQGPYRLTGKSGEQRILVLAGTEKVYLDGIEMVRGENNDYVIEYASGEIFFKPKRLITSASRITVDYEYAERSYPRNLLTAGGSARLFGDALSVTARYMREGDDETSPIDMQLGETDRSVLARAGDDPRKASSSGVLYLGLDSTGTRGAGQYARVDTLIDGAPAVYYRYAPGTDSATYSVTFSFVGTGAGEYARRTVGSFDYVGPNRGDYAPLRLLPLAQLQQLGNLRVTVKPANGLTLGAEGAVSALDRNRFSALDDGDNAGAAYNATVHWSQPTAAGEIEVSGRFRSTDAAFTPIDRINDIEFSRKWNLGAAATARETMREAAVGYRPFSPLRLNAGAGSISRGAFSSQRFEGGFTLAPGAADSALPGATYTAEFIRSSDGAGRGEWFRQRGNAEYRLGFATPQFHFEQERRESARAGSDSLDGSSLAFVDIRPGVRFPEFWNLTLSFNLGVRSEDMPLAGAFTRQSRDLLQQYTLSLRSWNDLSASAAVTVRDRRYSDAAHVLGNRDLQTILTKAQARYAPLQQAINADLLYEVSTERTSKLERVFIPVPFGQGNYVYAGDANGNGVQDENEFEPARFDGTYVLITLPTDELYPVIDLRASARLRLVPSRIIRQSASNSFLEDALRALSSETFARAEEKSDDERTSNIYLLRFRTFLSDSTTVRGYQNLRQDFFLFEQEQDFSLRFRFDQGRGFSQYALASERSYRRERSARLRTRPVREIGLQSDLVAIDDNVSSTAASNRARAIVSTAFTNDISYRPWPRVEIGVVIATKTATDRYPAVPVEAQIEAQTLRGDYSFEGPGRIHLELERNDVRFSTAVERFPFELTDGKAEGKSWILRASLDYRITSYLQSTVSYLGRSEGGRPMLHTGRAEVRAFF